MAQPSGFVPRASRPLDLVVFGASSFVGRLLCEELWRLYGSGPDGGTGGPLRWGLAGRSRARLEAVRDGLRARAEGEPSAARGAASGLPCLVADAADAGSLAALCRQARVVVSTVGPYALHGEPLVAACAASGTDYADLTGEVPWIRRMIERHSAAALASGARLVHCCGFDSIPSDLGVLFLQREAQRRLGAPCARVSMRVRAMRGGVSGGTVASLLNVLREAAADPVLRRMLVDPYSLSPTESAEVAGARRPRQPRTRGARFDPESGCWTAPFVMSAINVPVVLRSHALLGHPWGGGFTYDEAVSTGRGLPGRLRASGLAAGLAAFTVAGALAPTRALLERFVLPAPGEGPDEPSRRRGCFDLRFMGTTADGRHLAARVTGDRDPGYGSTARMLAQAATCLTETTDEPARRGGSWTPASLLGERLIERLEAFAGVKFELLPGR
ncbi:MAG: saccharopine dehydrogenase NADP-binding domain-containing protein [Steroidobacteraceae bacterium]|nr:saccharopine dehydrogenase NADP-binding domain-containing protein [Steroidobacteraceae bacterium]